jgi:hypothetical protein
MDKLNLNLRFKLDDEQKKKIVAKLVKNRRLFFILFLGGVTVYSFNVIFRKAYVEINYIQYPVQTNKLSSKESTMLDEIIRNIKEREAERGMVAEQKYADPFSFRGAAKGPEMPEKKSGTEASTPGIPSEEP